MTESLEKSAAEAPQQNVGNTVRASWPFSLHQVRANVAHCSPEGREAIVAAFLWCIDPKHEVSKPEFARLIGSSDNTIYKILSGKYEHPTSKAKLDISQDMIKGINQFLALERERFFGGANEFVVTPTVKRVWQACQLARESRTPLFLTGRSHIGKSWALERYAQDNNHGRTTYTRMKAASGLGGMVRRFAERHGISPNMPTMSIVDALKRAITPNMLLLLDELHLLTYTYRRASFFGCMEVIRELHDETGCGMVLCGTDLLLEKINEGRKGEMEQLLNRGVHRVVLPQMPTIADLTMILNHTGLDFPEKGLTVTVKGITDKPRDVLRYLAKTYALKAITERLRYARKLAQKAEEKISWEHFMTAHLIIEKQAQPEKDWE